MRACMHVCVRVCVCVCAELSDGNLIKYFWADFTRFWKLDHGSREYVCYTHVHIF